MNCCKKCFADKVIIGHINKTGKPGFCDYCEIRRQKVVEASSLCELFIPVVELFTPAISADEETIVKGRRLPNCIELDAEWKVFSSKFQILKKTELLDDIRCVEICQGFDEYEDRPESVDSSEMWTSPQSLFKGAKGEYVWNSFADTVKWKRRFLPDTSIGSLNNPKTWLPGLLRECIRPTTPRDTYFRARIGGEEEGFEVNRPFPPSRMGVPSARVATPNRANPRGIAYLYTAEAEHTAVSEISPYPGASISVARLNPIRDMQLVDLTNVLPLKSPFGLKDLKAEIEKHAILSILNRELSKPINKDLPDIEYAPTQYLAEVILEAGYDGIRYKSAMHSKGHNVVFFDASKVQVQPITTLVRVTATHIKYSKVREAAED